MKNEIQGSDLDRKAKCTQSNTYIMSRANPNQVISISISLTLLAVSMLGFQQYLLPKHASILSDVQTTWLLQSFYVFLCFDALCVVTIIWLKDEGLRAFLLCLSCLFPVLIQLVIPYSFAILLLVWSCTITVAGFVLTHHIQAFSLIWILCMCSLGHLVPLQDNFLNPGSERLSWFEFLILLIILILLSLLLIITQQARTLFLTTRDRLVHESQTNRQLSSFNAKLQTYAKQTKEETASIERNRITREMHDANGYAFTNIMALMNAAISSGNQEWSVIEGILRMTWKQAQQGLKESRKTLRILRSKLDEDFEPTVYQTTNEIAHIFRECTGTSVIVHWGNMESSYGSSIDKIISRIIQEGLVNSVRHGRATQVKIYFWEQNSTVFLSIEDNGCGSSHIVKGIGLTGMEERVSPYHGKVECMNLLEGGFKLMITLPLPHEEIEGHVGPIDENLNS